MELKKHPGIASDAAAQARNVFRIAVLILGGCVVVLLVFLGLILQTGAWQLYLLTGCLLVTSVFFVVSARLARHGRPGLAAWLLIVPVWAIILLSSAMLQGLGLVYCISAVFLTMTIAGQTLPSRQARQATAASLVIGLGALLLDQFEPVSQLSAPQLQTFIPIISAVFSLLFGYVILHELGANSIQIRIAFWAGLCLFPAVIIIISYATISLRDAALKDAESDAIIIAQAYAAYIEGEIEPALVAGRTLAQALAAVKRDEDPLALSREQVNAMLKQVLEDNPDFLGIYTLWEPNAFDGLDEQYVNAPAHDETGRFIPYWVRGAGGKIHVEAWLEYETEGSGDWYLLPKETHQERILDPFLYPIQGEDVLLTSLVTPLVVEGQFYGIVGVDLRIDFLQSLADEANIYAGAGKLALISNNGTLAGMSGQPEYVGQLVTALDQDYESDLPHIKQGARNIHYHQDELAVFVPIKFGRTETPWSVSVLVSMEKILADMTARLWNMVGVGALLMLLTLALLWFAAGRIARPIKEITGVAQAVAGGNLQAESQVTSGDEVGTLATAFNYMTAQLRQTLHSLEQRVAARTRALETSAEVSRRLSALLDQEQLVAQVVEQVQSAFGYYHAHIYLLDEASQSLALAGGTGKAGREMLDSAYKIPWGKGLIGRAAAANAAVLVPDVSQDAAWLPHPLLPDTRAEIAVPIALGQRVLGVLDVQHDVVGGLGQSDADLLGSVAGQVAIALQNTAFVKEIQAASQSLREANRIKDTFMSSMSHELRTPLNSIIGFSEVLLMGISGDLPAEAQEDVQAIFDNGRHLLGIINDLLDLAKIESGTLELHLESIEIATLFDDVRANNAGLLLDKPVEMLIQIEDDLPALQADPLRVNQILNNLVSNAAKFTDEGSITLCAYRDSEWVCLEVQDTGVGISEDNLDRVFERFQQTDDDHARSAKGTGLGLDITRQLVELHGGRIEVHSQLGKGSVFSVYLS